jgi:hypothetical protein
MNAYKVIEPLLSADGGRTSPFPPLDSEGRSVALISDNTQIDLLADSTADPDERDSLFFSLSMPLLTLEGADPRTQLAFLWNLAEKSTPGYLPPGYLLFANNEDMLVFLGGQFSAQGLELGLLETLTDEFYRYGQVLRESLTDLLQTLAEASPAPGSAVSPVSGTASEQSSSADPNEIDFIINQQMLRV